MSNWDDKIADQAQGYELLPGFDARPLAGPGRWAYLHNASTLVYTDDHNILFAKRAGDETTADYLNTIVAINHLFEQGKSATAAFELLIGDTATVCGDLSELA